MPDPQLLKETARLEREFPMQRIEPSQFEDLFEVQLRKYDSDREMIAEEERVQVKLAEQLQDANRLFNSARRADANSEQSKDREHALQELESGYLKYKEIISNIEVGRKFYNDLATFVSRFRDDCKKFVHARRLEAGQMEMYVFHIHSLILSWAPLLIALGTSPILPCLHSHCNSSNPNNTNSHEHPPHPLKSLCRHHFLSYQPPKHLLQPLTVLPI